METVWRPFSYLVIDRQAAQDQLNEWAGQGWELVKIRCSFAQLRRTERRDLSYFLDFDDTARETEEAEQYRQLCADAGWERVEQIAYLSVYASRPGTHPAPIQTDPELEYQRYRKKVLKQMRNGVILILGLLLVYWLLLGVAFPLPLLPRSDASIPWKSFVRRALSGSICMTWALFSTPPLWVGGLVYCAALALRLRRWRRDVDEGRPLFCHSPRTARLWGWLRRLGIAMLYLDLLLLPLDSMVNSVGNIGWAIGTLIGCGISLYIGGRTRRDRRYTFFFMVLAVTALAGALLHGPFRAFFPGRIPAGPVLSQAEVDHPVRRDAPLGSSAQWFEDMPDADFYREGSCRFTVYTWTSQALADWAFEVDMGEHPWLDADFVTYPATDWLLDDPWPERLAAAGVSLGPEDLEGVYITADGYTISRGRTQVDMEFYWGDDWEDPARLRALRETLDWMKATF